MARCVTNASTGNSCSAWPRPVSSSRTTAATTTRNGPTAASAIEPQPRPGWKLWAPVALRAPYAQSLILPIPQLQSQLNPKPPTRSGLKAEARSPRTTHCSCFSGNLWVCIARRTRSFISTRSRGINNSITRK